MSYKNLEVWKLAQGLVVEIHTMSMKLPSYELYETGSQIRRAIKSVKSNIVEGYGRRYYKQEFIRFLIYALASNDETIDHLETLFETKSLTDKEVYKELHDRLNILGMKLNQFLQSVEKGHKSAK
jgi:four helix bundle protein